MFDATVLPELVADKAVIEAHMPYLAPTDQETMTKHLAELERSINWIERMGS
jgi:hypothetical protein